MIYKKCVMTIDKNKATLDEDIYLYRLDKNIELYFTIVNNKYRFNKGDMNNIILITNASFFQVRLYKNAEIKYTFAIQPTDGGQAILTITDDLIDDPIEVGDYDFQISLLDEEKTSMISMPIVSKQLHVCEPLVSDDATMGKAILGLSKLATGEIKNAFDSEGNYIREIHQDGDILSASIINKFEEALDTNTKAIKNGTGTSYDDTEIKTDINTIKTDLGTEELTTTAKNVKGAVNEVNSQCKDIANLSLTKHTDGKIYIKKQDGTLVGTGVEVGNDVDLSKITMSMSGQTLKLMNDGTQITSVEIPTATVTDEQLTSIIQSKIDDGTLASIALGNNSVSTSNIQDEAITPNKTNFFKEEYINLLHGKTWTNSGHSGDDQTNFGSNFWVSDYVEIIQNVLYTVSPKMNAGYGGAYIGKMGCYDVDKNYLGLAMISNSSNIPGTSEKPGHRWIEEFTLLDNTKYVRIGFNNSHGNDSYSISETNRALTIISYTEVDENTGPNKRIFTITSDYLQNLIDAILIDKSVTSNKLSDIAIKEQFENNTNNNKILDYTHMKMFDMVENTDNLFTGIKEQSGNNNPIDSTVNTDSYGYQTLLTDFIDISSNNTLSLGVVSTKNSSSANLQNSLQGIYCFDNNKKYLGKATTEFVDFKTTNDTSGNYISMYLRFRAKEFVENTKYIRFGFNPTWINQSDINDTCIIRKTLPNFNEDAKLISLKMAEHYKLEGTDNASVVNPNLPLANKKVVWIGDSLSDWGGGSGTIGSTGFLDVIATNVGGEFYNQGTAGASWEYGLGTWDDTHTTYTPAEGETEYTAIGRVNTLVTNKDSFVPDYVIFMMGTNRRTDGNTTDEYTNLHTMCGAIKHCLLQIYNNFPNCAIGIVLPPQRQEGMDAQEQANEKIKTIANYYSVPTFDAFHEGGLLNHERNPLVSTVNSGGFSDGLHLSELGMAILGRKFSHWIKTL